MRECNQYSLAARGGPQIGKGVGIVGKTIIQEAREFLKQGESAVAPGLDERELAAYAGVASLLLNLDETITKE